MTETLRRDAADTTVASDGEAHAPSDGNGQPHHPPLASTPPQPRHFTPHLPRTFSALRHRNYRLYWSGQVVSLSGTWMQTTAQSWLIYQLTLSPFTLGVLNFANQVPTLVFSLFAGVLADRVNKRHLLILTQTLAMIQAFALAALVLTGHVQAWQVILLALVLGIINSFDNPARQSFVPEIVPKSDLMNAIALNATAFNGARIVGPALGGLVVVWLGVGGAFTLNGVSFLAVLAGLLMMTATPVPRKAARESMWTSLKEGVRYIRGDRAVTTLLLQATMVGVFGMPYATLMPVMAADVLGYGVEGYGLLMSATGVGAVVGGLTIASLGNFTHKGRIVALGDFTFPTMLLLFTFSRSLWLSMVLLAGMGMFLIMRNATTNTLLQTAVPDRLRGRVISVYMLMFIGMTPLGALQSGWLAQRYGAPFALQVGALALLGSATLVLWRRPEVRNLP